VIIASRSSSAIVADQEKSVWDEYGRTFLWTYYGFLSTLLNLNNTKTCIKFEYYLEEEKAT